MNCFKYILANTGTSVNTFTYRRCDDTVWEYQVELNPNQIKTIWALENTYSSSYGVDVISVELFTSVVPTPSITPSNTPTPSITPTNTPTPSVTPTYTPTPTVTETETPTPTPTVTQTETPTPTPTVTETGTPTPTPTQTITPTKAKIEFLCSTGSTPNDACAGVVNVSIFGEYPLFDDNVQFFDSAYGPVTTDMSGFYSYSNEVVLLDSSGVTETQFVSCAILPSQTPSETPTQTPTETPTSTPTPTTTPLHYSYILGYDLIDYTEACYNFTDTPSTYYTPIYEGPGPNIDETLYTDGLLTIPAPDGYYSNGTAWYEITGGAGLITSSDPNGCEGLPTQTPTETPTPTPTPTETETPTPTPTETETLTPTPTETETPTPTPTQTPSQTPGFVETFRIQTESSDLIQTENNDYIAYQN